MFVIFWMMRVLTDYLLQKNNIGMNGAKRVAQFGQYEFSVERGKSLVQIYCYHFQLQFGVLTNPPPLVMWDCPAAVADRVAAMTPAPGPEMYPGRAVGPRAACPAINFSDIKIGELKIL